MSQIWLPIPKEPPKEHHRPLDHILVRVVRYGIRAEACPLCGCGEALTVGHLDKTRCLFRCGTEVALGFVKQGDDCHWEVPT